MATYRRLSTNSAHNFLPTDRWAARIHVALWAVSARISRFREDQSHGVAIALQGLPTTRLPTWAKERLVVLVWRPNGASGRPTLPCGPEG
jgi:hypothetical protein